MKAIILFLVVALCEAVQLTKEKTRFTLPRAASVQTDVHSNFPVFEPRNEREMDAMVWWSMRQDQYFQDQQQKYQILVAFSCAMGLFAARFEPLIPFASLLVLARYMYLHWSKHPGHVIDVDRLNGVPVLTDVLQQNQQSVITILPFSSVMFFRDWFTHAGSISMLTSILAVVGMYIILERRMKARNLIEEQVEQVD